MKILALSIESTGGQPIKVETPGNVPTGGIEVISQVVQKAVVLAFTVGILLCLFMLLFAGIKWVTSGGEKEGVDSARKMITYAIIGLVILFLSFFIINVIGYLFGVDILGVNLLPRKTGGGSLIN